VSASTYVSVYVGEDIRTMQVTNTERIAWLRRLPGLQHTELAWRGITGVAASSAICRELLQLHTLRDQSGNKLCYEFIVCMA